MGAEANADAFEDGEFLMAENLGDDFAHFGLVPAGVAVVVLIVFSPVSVLSGIESRVGWNDRGDLVGVRHVVVGLALEEIVKPLAVDRIGSELVVFAAFRRVGVGMLAGARDVGLLLILGQTDCGEAERNEANES